MTSSEPLIDIPFDQYSRQFQVAELVNKLRKQGQKFTILDVGGYKGKTAEFFPDDSVKVLDVYDVDEPNYIKGSGLGLPFADDSFDIVVNFDVLEHIPKNERKKFADECKRVAKRAFFICAPHKTPENEEAEKNLNNLYKALHGKDHEWLEEHIAYTLPDAEAIKGHLEKQNIYVSEYTSNDTLVWLLMQSVIFINSKYPLAAPYALKINKDYNIAHKYDGAENKSVSYRLILCCTKTKKDHELLSKYFSNKNNPLTDADKIGLLEKIFKYHTDLLAKMTEEKQSYKDHHEQAKLRIVELEAQNGQLVEEVERLNTSLLAKVSNVTKRSVGRIKGKSSDER